MSTPPTFGALDVFVGSENPVEVKLVANVVADVYRGFPVSTQGYRVESGVRSQPVGDRETMKGVRGRLQCLRNILRGRTNETLLIALEHGIVRVNKEWFLRTWVGVESELGNQALAQSAGVQIPREYVEAARSVGFHIHTVAAVMRQKGNDDPVATLTSYLVTQQGNLRHAINIAIGELLHQTPNCPV
jgi:non-canonical (house-cleaning) NTP pyrophosphatase